MSQFCTAFMLPARGQLKLHTMKIMSGSPFQEAGIKASTSPFEEAKRKRHEGKADKDQGTKKKGKKTRKGRSGIDRRREANNEATNGGKQKQQKDEDTGLTCSTSMIRLPTPFPCASFNTAIRWAFGSCLKGGFISNRPVPTALPFMCANTWTTS
jgi:hypothetical protein